MKANDYKTIKPKNLNRNDYKVHCYLKNVKTAKTRLISANRIEVKITRNA